VEVEDDFGTRASDPPHELRHGTPGLCGATQADPDRPRDRENAVEVRVSLEKTRPRVERDPANLRPGQSRPNQPNGGQRPKDVAQGAEPQDEQLQSFSAPFDFRQHGRGEPDHGSSIASSF